MKASGILHEVLSRFLKDFLNEWSVSFAFSKVRVTLTPEVSVDATEQDIPPEVHNYIGKNMFAMYLKSRIRAKVVEGSNER